MHRIRAITLDLDDTLWPIGPVIERAERELWTWLGKHYPRLCEHFSPARSVDLRRDIARRYPHKAHDFRYLRGKTLENMAEEAGYDTAMAEEAFDVFDRWRNRVDLYPDVEPALRNLRSRYAVVAVTNGNACIDTIGIGRYFNGIVSAAEAGHAKPAPAIFRAAVLRTGVPADAVLHVGDHPQTDIAGAAAAGLRTAWVNRAGASWPEDIAPPDVTVSSMQDLDRLLAEAGRKQFEGSRRDG